MKPRLLANENVPLPSVALLRDAGFDVLAIAESNPGLPDHVVLNMAVVQTRWIITFDRDYGDLIFARNLVPPPALIFIRVRSYRPDDPGRILVELLAHPEQFAGQFVVVHDDSIRRRPLPTITG